jgi:hypothetical protein
MWEPDLTALLRAVGTGFHANFWHTVGIVTHVPNLADDIMLVALTLIDSAGSQLPPLARRSA